MAQSSNEDNVAAIVAAGAFLVLTFAWLSIPGSGSVNGFQVASHSFANGIFVGWADDIAAALFSDSASERSQAIAKYRDAILTGERRFPIVVLIFSILGTFLSIGGVIAVLMARSASSAGDAFKLGFFAEIGEGVVWHVGYSATTKQSALSVEEVVITIIVAVIMGCVAMSVQSKAVKTA